MIKLFYTFTLSIMSLGLCGQEVEAITKPSADVTLSFVRSGLIKKIVVKQGDRVRQGQLLSQLESKLEENKVTQLKSSYENKTKILAEENQLALKKMDLKDLQDAYNDGVGTKKEVNHADAEVKSSEYTIQQLEFENKQVKLQLEEAQILLEQTRLTSPVEGVIETVFADEGEGIERLTEIIRLVRIDPLWVDVPVPLSYKHLVRNKKTLPVKFGLGDNDEIVETEGKIIYQAALADPGSETVVFRLEVANPKGRLAGERVIVELSPSQVE